MKTQIIVIMLTAMWGLILIANNPPDADKWGPQYQYSSYHLTEKKCDAELVREKALLEKKPSWVKQKRQLLCHKFIPTTPRHNGRN